MKTAHEFVMLALRIFVIGQLIQMARGGCEAKKAETPAAIPAAVKLLSEIRDLLAKK